MSAERAQELADGGAGVVWDACGCGGGCGLDWYAPHQVRQMVAAGPPSIRNNRKRHAFIAEWASADGSRLLLVEQDVRWGNVIP